MVKILNFDSEISYEKFNYRFLCIVFIKVDTVSVLVHDWVAWSSWSP